MTTTFQYSKEYKNKDWHCVVHQKPWDFQVSVYLMFVGGGSRKIAKYGKGGFTLVDYREGAIYEPFLVLPYEGWQSILQCIGGITPDEQVVETGSELKATKYHLEDMRALLKIGQL